MATTASSSSTVYENITDTQSMTSHLNGLKFADSDRFDVESCNSFEKLCEPLSSSRFPLNEENEHIYTNVREMDEMNGRQHPPVPDVTDIPKRNLNNGWMEFATEAGRTFFYNFESGKSQWIPPRFLRTPAQIQAMFKAARTEADETDSSDVLTYNFEKIPAVSSETFSKDQGLSKELCSNSIYGNILESDHNHKRFIVEPILRDHEQQIYEDIRQSSSHGKHTSDDLIISNVDAMVVGSLESNKINKTQNSAGPATIIPRRRSSLIKSAPLQQILPVVSGDDHYLTMSDNHSRISDKLGSKGDFESGRESLDSRGGSNVELREPVKTIKCGNMERLEALEQARLRKREWTVSFMYLTSAHLILYKDEKSAEKHGNHYAAPLGVCDLKGANVSWITGDKKKRKVIQLELCTGCRYFLRTSSDSETQLWFDSLRDVIGKLPIASHSSGLPIQPAVLDSSCAIVRNPSILSNRPHSVSTTNRFTHRPDVTTNSALESSNCNELRPSRESILEKLRRFFRTRPSVESLKEKGIYKPEPVFGSTLTAICQLENSLVPKFIRTVTELIESRGLEVDGLYRVSGNLSAVQRIRCQVDQDKYTSLVNEEDVHVLTGALKLFFRELVEPVFPLSSTKDYLNAIKLQNQKQRFKRFDELLKALPSENRETLKMLLRHLHRVATHSYKNRMQIHNLALMFGPTLFNSGEERTGFKKKDVNKKKKDPKKDEPIHSNSHLAFNMIMQGQIVEYLLTEHNKFEALQGPIQTYPT